MVSKMIVAVMLLAALMCGSALAGEAEVPGVLNQYGVTAGENGIVDNGKSEASAGEKIAPNLTPLGKAEAVKMLDELKANAKDGFKCWDCSEKSASIRPHVSRNNRAWNLIDFSELSPAIGADGVKYVMVMIRIAIRSILLSLQTEGLSVHIH